MGVRRAQDRRVQGAGRNANIVDIAAAPGQQRGVLDPLDRLAAPFGVAAGIFGGHVVGVPPAATMLHLGTMTKHEMPKGSARGSNAPQPVRTLRDWLDHLAARDRLAVIKPNANLRFEVAAYAKRLDGQRATMFPCPGRPSDAGGVRPDLGSRLDGGGDGCRARRCRHALSGGVAQPDPVAGNKIRSRAGQRRIATSIWCGSCRCRPTTSTTAGPTSAPA